jgi:Tol biopolymer transport system component
MSLTTGSRLGAYEIVSALGAGGMGEVYRARDPRLDREVAIKVLSAALASDPVALARFEREAMSVAKLAHPNILSIFEFGHAGDNAFVVTELVDGETLRARLERGPLPPRRAIAYAQEIARGIAAAHARGIVHRDLKPENVMITRDDHIKILDFGLAKPVEAHGSEQTRVTGIATDPGVVLGTFGYMAPEQVRGLDVDQRADMFAFGAVLYEMLTGQRAFRGETAADTMTAILTQDPPDVDTARLSISPGLERVIRRCLEKSRDLRFQSANDLAFALETLSTVSTSSAATLDTTPARRGWLPWSVAGAAIVMAIAALVMRGSSAAPADPSATGGGPWASFTRITETAGEETGPTLSPDGNTIAYAMRSNNGSRDIYAQRVGGRNATPIVNDPQYNEGGAAFSPDGALIAFHRSEGVGGIFVAGATGESVRRISDAGFDPAWSPDGKQIAYATEEVVDPYSRQGESTLFAIDVAGGTPRKLANADAVQPSWSPSGERVVFWRNRGGQRDILTVSAKGGDEVPVTTDAAVDWSPVWSPDGQFVYFSSDRGTAVNLWRIAVDQSSGRVRGRPEPVTAGVQAASGLPRFSKDGSRLAFRSRVASVNPVAIPFDPATLRAGTPSLLETRNNIRVPTGVSPDGKQIAFYSLGEPQEDLFIGSPDGVIRRVTDDPGRDRGPIFTPDGRSLVFYSNRDGRWAIWTIGVDGGGRRKIVGPEGGAVLPTLSPKGDRLIFVDGPGQSMFLVPLGTDAAVPTKLEGTGVGERVLSANGWSPDGARIAGPLNWLSGRPGGIGVYDVAAKKTVAASDDDETNYVRWLDSRTVMYFAKNGSELVALDTVTRKRTTVNVQLPGPAAEGFAISPDGRTIYYGAERAEADIWIVERK